MARVRGLAGIEGPPVAYLVPLVVAALLCAALAGLAWRRRRQTPGALAFAVLMLVIGEWSLAYALELAATDLTGKLFFDQLEYVGIVANPLAALAFAVQYTGRGPWLTPARLVTLGLVPATTLALVWSNPAHGLVQSAAVLDVAGSYPALVLTHGPWFWVNTAYSYLLLAVVATLLVVSLVRSPRPYWPQIGAMLLGIFAPLASNAIYLAGRAPVAHLDLTPFAFTLTGVAMFVAFFRLGFLERYLGLPRLARSILVSRLPDPVILLDARGTIVEANPAALSVLGQPGEAVVGRQMAAFLPDWAAGTDLRQKRQLSRREISLGPPEATRSFDLLVAPQYLARTLLVGWVLVLREITERKRIEDALYRSERRFRLLIERAADVFTIVGSDGTVRYVSPSVQVVLGLSPDALLGTSSLALVHPEDVPRALATLSRVVHDPSAAQSAQVRCRHADGSWRWFEVVAVNLLAEPAVAGIVSTMRDITDRKQVEAEREAMLARELAARAQAEGAVRLRDDFLSIAAHELKTPITAVRLAVQALFYAFDRDVPADSPLARRALVQIDAQSVKLTRLVLQLLETSRLQLGRLILEPAEVDFAALVRAAVDDAQARTTEHSLVLAAPAEQRVVVDALRTEQVIANLLDNAIKYSPDGGRIDVTLEGIGRDRISLSVRDRGIGIPADRRDHIFDLFYQAHRESHQSGMGIGLYIARQIVELHGGRIGVAFPPDGGTCFRVELPLVADRGVAGRASERAAGQSRRDRRAEPGAAASADRSPPAAVPDGG